MFKKLDKLILKAFAGPFVVVFFITLFVLVLQFCWLYIDDIVGKGLDMLTIGRLMLYVSATVVPLALPLAILLSSIMTFGNLGETFELVAIKSAGIPLLRFMRPLLITTIIICGVAFVFNNNIIPRAQLKMNTLKNDIISTKPAFDIKEGVFYDRIDGFVIKIGKKERDSVIRNVVIYQTNYALQDDMTVADSGLMRVTPDKRYIEFILQNGWRYSEKGERYGTNTDYTRMGFKTYKKVLDISSFKFQATSDSVYKDNWRMLTIGQLQKSIDTVKKTVKESAHRSLLETNAYINATRNILDSNWKIPKDTGPKPTSFSQIVPDSLRSQVYQAATGQINSVKSIMLSNATDYDARKKELNLHLIEWHRKFSMSVACLVLFLIGAPLGSIIRKGGIGLPLVFAVVFFVVFFLLNNFGEKFVKEDVLSPQVGMWLATAVLLPIGIFLTIKAMRDSQLFNREYYYRLLARFRKKRNKPATGENTTAVQ